MSPPPHSLWPGLWGVIGQTSVDRVNWFFQLFLEPGPLGISNKFNVVLFCKVIEFVFQGISDDVMAHRSTHDHHVVPLSRQNCLLHTNFFDTPRWLTCVTLAQVLLKRASAQRSDTHATLNCTETISGW